MIYRMRECLPHQSSIKFTDEDYKLIQSIKKKNGFVHDSEAVRYALRKALELLEAEEKARTGVVSRRD